MSNYINYPNQQLPSYSGITINITNPNLTAPMSGNTYCVPQHSVCNEHCGHNYLPPNNTQTEVNVDNRYAFPEQNRTTNPITDKPTQQIEAVSPTQNAAPTNSGIENNSTNGVKQDNLPQAYPSGYYINNYNVQNPQQIPTNNTTPAQDTIPEQAYIDNTAQQNPKNSEVTVIPPVNSSPAVATNSLPNKEEIYEEEQNMDSSTEIINKLNTRVKEEKELEKNGKKTRVVALTNEYIMSLENYLNNPNKEIRLMAAKEILTRLDEDKDRYDDLALNALLNKMLQDPDKLVRIAALSAFSSQLASGNDFTVELLNKIQNDPNADKEDVLEAANILLKMSSSTEIKYVPVKKNSDSAKKTDQEQNEKQIAQLKEQLQKYKEKEIEQMLKAQGM